MQVMLIYSGFAAARWAVGSAPGYVPLASGVVISFVDAYFYLAVGCLLGLAVFKRANELGGLRQATHMVKRLFQVIDQVTPIF
jgi:hypothetical protein